MPSARVERAACCLGGNRSIHLSYEDMINDAILEMKESLAQRKRYFEPNK